MREIKFRAIPALTKGQLEFNEIPVKDGFVYGNYSDGYILGPIVEADGEYCVHEWWCPVKTETIEQYTGLHDKNGREVYEGDIVKYGSDWGNVGTVVYDVKFGYCIEYKIEYRNRIVRTRQEYFADIQSEIEVVGNVHENADLLEVPK